MDRIPRFSKGEEVFYDHKENYFWQVAVMEDVFDVADDIFVPVFCAETEYSAQSTLLRKIEINQPRQLRSGPNPNYEEVETSESESESSPTSSGSSIVVYSVDSSSPSSTTATIASTSPSNNGTNNEHQAKFVFSVDTSPSSSSTTTTNAFTSPFNDATTEGNQAKVIYSVDSSPSSSSPTTAIAFTSPFNDATTAEHEDAGDDNGDNMLQQRVMNLERANEKLQEERDTLEKQYAKAIIELAVYAEKENRMRWA